MKHRLVLSAGALLLIAAFAAPAAERIGYVDLQRVITESAAGKRAKAEIENMVKQKREQIAREEQKLKAMQQAFEKDKLVLTEVQKRAKQREFQDKFDAYQKLSADSQREVSEKDAEFSQKAMTDIRVIIRELAQQEKLMIVFEKNSQPVLYAEEGPDLTDKVIKAYDAKAKN